MHGSDAAFVLRRRKEANGWLRHYARSNNPEWMESAARKASRALLLTARDVATVLGVGRAADYEPLIAEIESE